MRKSVNELALPKERPGVDRAVSWQEALEHGGLGKAVVRRVLRKFDPVFAAEIAPDLEASAWEGILVAVETYSQVTEGVTFATWATKIATNAVYSEVRRQIAQRGGTLNTRINSKVEMPLRFENMSSIWLDEEDNAGVEAMRQPYSNTASSLVASDFSDAVDERLDAENMFSKIREWIPSLPHPERDIARLLLNGLRHEEIRDYLGLRKSTYFRALRSMREQMQGLREEVRDE